MRLDELVAAAKVFAESDAGNRIDAAWALAPEIAGTVMYEPPIFAVGAADDPLFAEFKKPSVVHERSLTPEEWLPGARSVVAFFLPATRAVRESNARDLRLPSPEWLHARIEGQRFIAALTAHLVARLAAEGHAAVAPAIDPRFWTGFNPKPGADGVVPPKIYASNWSERHAAYACGLGTFCLSKGMITAKGVCGRFGSVITACALPPTPRPYRGLYDYCTFCGACARNCPAGAITLEGGKLHPPCDAYVAEVGRRFAPRYGCAKCQVKTPCESGIPPR